MPTSFVHLRLHSEFSLTDGLIRIKDLVNTAQEQSLPALALTDANNLYALVKFYQATQKAGIKPLIGCDLTLAENTTYQGLAQPEGSLTLLAKNNLGYKNLLKLISRSWLEGQQLGKPFLQAAWLEEAGACEGLIALSGAKEGALGKLLLNNKPAEAQALASYFSQLFPQAFYLEIQRTGRLNDEDHLHLSVALSQTTGLPLVATNDVRFLNQADYAAHELRVCISQGEVLDNPNREKVYSQEQYLKTPAQMLELFSDLPSALANSVEIAKRCNVTVELGKNYLPQLPLPEGETEEEHFKRLCNEGLVRRLAQLEEANQATFSPEERQSYQQRLDFELNTIIGMGFVSYFLIVAEFISWAKQEEIPVGPGRGSGAGSLVAYVLDITDLDPLHYDLFFERFLNPERVSMPDFDIDFCMEGRDKVIDHVIELYGQPAVSQIVTFGTMAAKAVVRDVARAQGLPYAVGDRLAKAIPFEVGMTLTKAAAEVEDLQKLEELYQARQEAEKTDSAGDLPAGINPEEYEVWRMARQLEGLARNTGKHAGGVVIAPERLTDFSPVMADEEGKGQVVQFDKDDIEAAGLVKFDFLGLRTLTLIDKAFKSINRLKAAENQPPISTKDINLSCAKTFNLMKAAQTLAVFQLESSGMRDLVHRLQPSHIEDVIALVALFRPGPLQSGMADDFIERKHGRQAVAYPHKDYQDERLKEALEPTYGVVLYQEQVMQIAQILAGYSLGAADLLRRAMGRKDPEEMQRQRQIFIYGDNENIPGSVANGLDEHKAGQIFDLVEKFAGYGFNKSHSAAYGLLSFHTAWLKTHYPAAFMAAVMSTEMDDTEKLVGLIKETQRLGIELSPPSVNQGDWEFIPKSATEIVYGLGAIKGVGQSPVQAIIQARKEGTFSDVFDFCQKIDLSKTSSRCLEALINSGALDELTPNACHSERHLLLAALPDAVKTAQQHKQNASLGMTDLFAASQSQPLSLGEVYAPYLHTACLPAKTRLAAEKNVLGHYISGHPINEHQAELDRFISKPLASVCKKNDNRKTLRLAGLLASKRIIRNKKGQNLASLLLEDTSGQLEATLFADDFETYAHLLEEDSLLLIEGEVRHDTFNDAASVRIKSLTPLENMRSQLANSLQLNLKPNQLTASLAQQLAQLCQQFINNEQGLPLTFHFTSPLGQAQLTAAAYWKLNPVDELLTKINQLVGENTAQVSYISPQ